MQLTYLKGYGKIYLLEVVEQELRHLQYPHKEVPKIE
jgi:hypothetical protein